MISGHGNIETAVNSIKKGAYDFVEKPFDSELLIFKIKKAIENLVLKKQIESFVNNDTNSELVANSKSSRILKSEINKISKTETNVLIVGDDGSGKEFIASKIHNYSYRANKNFRSIDCQIDQEKLGEELFGIEENQAIKVSGILDQINNGTVYLKNLEFMSKALQGKILRILEEKKYYRLGALNSNALNFRVIASSKTGLKRNEKKLRDDLLKKLNFSIILIPNLEDRKDDIEELIRIFSSKISKEEGIVEKKFSKDAISYLINLTCIKNISQLQKFLEWSIVMLKSNEITEISMNILYELMKDFTDSNILNNSINTKLMDFKIKEAREDFEKKYLIYNLEKFKYNVSKMSSEIGMERTALYRKLKLLKIDTEIK
jgi:two-component system nitrogen regulation response regulator NtrX